jgi:hypothetical protein
MKFLPRQPEYDRVFHAPVAHDGVPERAFRRPADAFRERDREPVRRRHERLYPPQPGVAVEGDAGDFPQFRGRKAPQPPRQQNMRRRDAWRVGFEYYDPVEA